MSSQEILEKVSPQHWTDLTGHSGHEVYYFGIRAAEEPDSNNYFYLGIALGFSFLSMFFID